MTENHEIGRFLRPRCERPIYLITDGGRFRRDGTLVPRIRAALAGAGEQIFAVQIREQVAGGPFPPATDEELLRLAEAIMPYCRERGVKLIVNRNIDAARSLEADGLHLGAEDELSVEAHKSVPLVGRSVHRLEELAMHAPAAADYLLCSPVFSPLSKQSSLVPLCPDGLRQFCGQSRKLIFALGGITPENAAQCRDAGADGVAMISSVLGARDPRLAAASISGAWLSKRLCPYSS